RSSAAARGSDNRANPQERATRLFREPARKEEEHLAQAFTRSERRAETRGTQLGVQAGALEAGEGRGASSQCRLALGCRTQGGAHEGTRAPERGRAQSGPHAQASEQPLARRMPRGGARCAATGVSASRRTGDGGLAWHTRRMESADALCGP